MNSQDITECAGWDTRGRLFYIRLWGVFIYIKGCICARGNMTRRVKRMTDEVKRGTVEEDEIQIWKQE